MSGTIQEKIDQFFVENQELPQELLEGVKDYYSCDLEEALEILQHEFYISNKDSPYVLAIEHLESYPGCDELSDLMLGCIDKVKLHNELRENYGEIECKGVTYYFFW